jgi:hypothetical protein
MKDDIEKAGSVNEALEILFSGGALPTPQSTQINELKDSILVSAVQTFIQMMPRFLSLTDDQKKEFIGALMCYHSQETDPIVRNEAFYVLYEYLLDAPPAAQEEIPEPQKTIERFEASTTPCEDCQEIPTNRIKFTEKNRSEEHFLCERCEESTRHE